MDRHIKFTFNSKDQLMHFTNTFEILYVLAGQVAVSDRERSFTLGKDEFIVLSCYQMYSVSYAENAQSISLNYSSEFYEKSGVGPVKCISITHPEMHDVYDEIRARLANLYQIYMAGRDQYELYLMSDSYELLGILRQYFRNDDLPGADGGHELGWLRGVMEYIESHYTEEVLLRDLSKEFHVSEGHLSRAFKQQIGLSFTEYVRKLRINRARTMLRKTSRSVTYIAGDCGFSYVNTFIEAFKKEVGMTPQKYRKKSEEGQIDAGSATDNNAGTLLKHLRETDFERFQEKREMIPPVEVNVNMKTGRSRKHSCHDRSIKISHARLLIFEEVREALRGAGREFGYEYVHIHGILDDIMNVCRRKPTGEIVSNYVYVDMVVDFILSIGMKPWIEIGYTPYCLKNDPSDFLSDSCLNLPDSLDEWEVVVKDFIKHLTTKYGKRVVEQWRFAPVYELYSYYGIYSLSDYLNYYERFFFIIRGILPKAIITGWGFQLETIEDEPDSEFIQSLVFCRDKGILPDIFDFQFFHIDFSKIEVRTIGQAIRTQHKALAVIHNDPDYLTTKLDLAKRLMESCGVSSRECAVGSWNCGLWQRDMSNDTCFKAAFIVKNVLENAENLSELTYCNLSDFTEQILDTPKAFHGGNGLVTYQNIRKPAYFAFSFLNSMSDMLVSKGRSFCVTRSKDGRQIDILLYHYCHYAQNADEDDQLSMNEDKFDRYGAYGYHAPLSISLHLHHMAPGRYTIERYIVNREQGSSFDTWLLMGAPTEINEEQKKYLMQQSQPRYIYKTTNINNKGELDVSALLQIYEIQHICIKMSDI